MTRLSATVGAVFALLPSILHAQGNFGVRVATIREATSTGDHARAVLLADSLGAWLPEQPNATLVRAVAYASAGHDAKATAAIRQLMRWDPRFARRAFQDSSLVRLRDAFRNVNLDSLIQRADQQVSNGAVWATIQERDLVPEGTAWDPATRSVLIGSLNKNKVIAIAPDGTVSDRVARNANGLGSVVGIHVDSARGILWVASNPRFDVPTDTATPALFAFDARTGAFRRRIHSPDRGAFLNDLTTGLDGAVYITDTRGGRVYVLRPGADALAPFEPVGTVISPNGITISPDGRHLLVADTDHIKVTPLPSGPTRRLMVPDTINVASLDGLAMTGNMLLAHHPLSYWRVARYSVDPGLTRIVRADFIERNTPDSRTSTTGEIGGDFYYYIGNGQIDRMNSRTIDAASMEPIRIYRVSRSPAR